MTEKNHCPQRVESPVLLELSEIDVSEISNPVLARLIEEVRNDESSVPHAYNRTHNRHNRGR